MASQQQPAPAAKPQAPAPTAITDLCGDLLCEIFLRLPSLPSLVRAAVSCRAFLAAVRSSPPFRRRFRALHPPPLLGFFFDPDGAEMPTFTPIPIRRRSDPDLFAAVRRADVSLTGVSDQDDAFPWWQLAECRGGYLLLLNWRSEQITAYNPLTRALDVFPMPPDAISDDCHGEFAYTDFFFLSSKEPPGSFRVLSLCHDKSRLRVAVFLSTTREWRILPWTGDVPAQPSGKKHWLCRGTQVKGLLCWLYAEDPYMVVLDTATLQFSFIDLPEYLKGKYYMAGETENGKLRMISVTKFTLYVWLRKADADGVEKWMLDSEIPLEGKVLRATESSRDDHDHGLVKLKVWTILDGVVYLSTFERFRDYRFRDCTRPCWFLSFCLETKKLEKMFRKRNDSHARPYIMAWPPSFVGNN